MKLESIKNPTAAGGREGERLRLTRHARQRCAERGISLQDISDVMAQPEVSRPSHRRGFVVLWRDGVKVVVGGGRVMTVARTAVPITLEPPRAGGPTEVTWRPVTGVWL